ncbi:hypothetical protein JCM30566_13600 [Marinitoga arctica]
MKSKIIMGIILIFSLSLIYAHGGNIETPINGNYREPLSINIELKIIEINNQKPEILAVDEKGKNYILRMENILMFYEDIPIEEEKEIKIEAIKIYSFSKIEELLVTSIEIDNKEYVTPKKIVYRMMDMMGRYGYPGMIDDNYNMMNSPYNYLPNNK